MNYKEVLEIMNQKDEAFSKLFEEDGFSFKEDVYLDNLDPIYYDNEVELDEMRENAIRFGSRIIDNFEIHVPAELKFSLRPGYGNVLFAIVRNGAEFEIYDFDGDELQVTYTELGKNLQKYAKQSGISLLEMYYIAADMAKNIFKINL